MQDSDVRVARVMAQMRALEELLEHPGWELLAREWREAEAEYDAALHGERADDVVRITVCQASCKVLREVLTTPERLIAGLRETLE